ncbi:MAG: peptide chain release factor N(5)-glutamine methyltransferase [Armatimonadetes bacterium]|nr:peptide chain release factor N(5)-glutamine methyltransferase [Armatimonadota bacterium]
MTAGEWIGAAEEALRRAGFESPRLEAEVLAAHALSVPRDRLLPHPERDVPDLAVAALLERRLSGEPLAYVLGKKEFFGREFHVNPAVLIPRPETETLVEAVLEAAPTSGICADVGTGSGVIAVTLSFERPGQRWAGTDVSARALAVARMNGEALGAQVSWLLADGLTAFRTRSLDVVASNPPYVDPADPRLESDVRRWEPSEAFHARGGLSFIRRLVAEARRALKPGGVLAFEFGKGQEKEVEELLSEACETRIIKDLAGTPRVALATLVAGA